LTALGVLRGAGDALDVGEHGVDVSFGPFAAVVGLLISGGGGRRVGFSHHKRINERFSLTFAAVGVVAAVPASVS
jgi:hypothetical protein